MADMNDIPENSFLWDGADEASTGRSHGAEPAWKRNRGPVMDDCELPGFTDEHKADPRALFTTFALGSPRTDDWGFKMDTPDDLDQRRFAKAQPAPRALPGIMEFGEQLAGKPQPIVQPSWMGPQPAADDMTEIEIWMTETAAKAKAAGDMNLYNRIFTSGNPYKLRDELEGKIPVAPVAPSEPAPTEDEADAFALFRVPTLAIKTIEDMPQAATPVALATLLEADIEGLDEAIAAAVEAEAVADMAPKAPVAVVEDVPVDPVEELKRENAELKAMMQELLAKVGSAPAPAPSAPAPAPSKEIRLDQIKLVTSQGAEMWRYKSGPHQLRKFASKYTQEQVLALVQDKYNKGEW